MLSFDSNLICFYVVVPTVNEVRNTENSITESYSYLDNLLLTAIVAVHL